MTSTHWAPKVDDSKKCPECFSSNLYFEGARDRYPPKRKGDQPGEDQKPVAKTITVRCGRCGNVYSITRKVK